MSLLQDLDSPHLKKSLPRYLDLERKVSVFWTTWTGPIRPGILYPNSVFKLRPADLRAGGAERHRCAGQSAAGAGKGNKERMLFLNEACQSALEDWLTERSMLTLVDQNALFVTLQNRRRISRAAVHKL